MSTVDSPQLQKLKGGKVLVGDLEDAKQLADCYDVIIGNCHCEALVH
jgi:nitrogenase molybdenum-iron protein NifN